MTVFVTFTMGAKESYFFNTPTHWARHNLPPDLETLFTKQPPIRDVLELALGENGAYFISYRDHDGQIFCRHYNLPNPLTTYLYHSHPHVIRDLSTLSISLGPYESYYAHDKSSASWANLPPALDKAILGRLESQDAWKTVWKESGREAPSFVSLGADGSYFMRTVGGGGSWDLKSKEEGMAGTNKFLENSKDFTGIAGLYLFSNYPNSYVLLLTNGKAFSNLPEHTWPDYNKMAPSLPNLTQTLTPIPPMPIPQQQPPPPQPQPHQTGCCPPSGPLAPHNCCPQTPQYASPFPPPYSHHRPGMSGMSYGHAVGCGSHGALYSGQTGGATYSDPSMSGSGDGMGSGFSSSGGGSGGSGGTTNSSVTQ
ncbi:hypothetical protein K469DRAFT_717558 [Zopfia rhizophila CBS 207.26]|uniref:Uncharacterized protein n=1 Tax=Zopfia rhizophila CBS 207.26 TaxID=1314779 RepID=A0A6A6DHT6_9PEZI|nr:hypothetical protein K469DRAFT_717558 [Zopfia rhizophila CBS 207.26]